jgi:hypothetical protein
VSHTAQLRADATPCAAGEKKLRSLLATTLEWNSAAERARTVRSLHALHALWAPSQRSPAVTYTCAHRPTQAELADAQGMVELGGALRSKRCACLRKPHFLFLAREWRYASDIWNRKGQKRRSGGNAGGAAGGGDADGAPLARQSQRMRAKREADDSVAPLALPAPPALPAASLAAHPPSRLAPVGMQVQARGALAPCSLAPGSLPFLLASDASFARTRSCNRALQPETAWLLVASQLRPLSLESTQLVWGDQARVAAATFGSDHITREALEVRLAPWRKRSAAARCSVQLL